MSQQRIIKASRHRGREEGGADAGLNGGTETLGNVGDKGKWRVRNEKGCLIGYRFFMGFYTHPLWNMRCHYVNNIG